MKNRSTLNRALSFIGRYRLLLFLSLLLAALIVAGTLIIPLTVGEAIDLITDRDSVDIGGVVKYLAITAAVTLVTAVLQWLMSTINNKITYHTSRDMRNAAFRKLNKLPLSYIDGEKKGDTVSRIINDVDSFSEGLLLGFTQLFTGILTILGTLAFMLVIDWKIALVVVLLTPISLFIARFIGSRTHSMFTLRSKTNAEAVAHIDESLSGQKVILAFSHTEKTTEKFDEINGRLTSASLRAIFFSSLVNPTTRFVNNLVYAAVALTGALTAVATAGTSVAFTVGQLTCLLSYTNQYTKPFNEISGVITEFQNALASAKRVFELIDKEAEIPDAENARVLTDAKGDVKLDGVSFSYTEQKRLIENLTLDIKAGERVAIVGPTGCGKTTLINLLMRFYDVKDGSIAVDGTDIRNITRHSLRESYGMVLQETWLSNTTVRDNIAFGNPDATDDEIVAAAKAAHAHSFIKRLPNGYDTVVGDGGAELSAGQRQLICIARVMLTLPPMLILDEATSSIDTRTEIKIQSAFDELTKGKTSFIVAHRLSTIKSADKILVMKEGNVVEQGNHEQLLQQKGFYYTLYNSQFES